MYLRYGQVNYKWGDDIPIPDIVKAHQRVKEELDDFPLADITEKLNIQDLFDKIEEIEDH
jgi:hypothetical protein